MGKIYYLMGKSASGKDHIYENLIQETALDLKPFVLYTTRPIRSGEQDGREYFFVDEKRLSELREAGKIIEERMYSTVQGPWQPSRCSYQEPRKAGCSVWRQVPYYRLSAFQLCELRH